MTNMFGQENSSAYGMNDNHGVWPVMLITFHRVKAFRGLVY